jgi:hypothetical protein
LVLGLGTYVQAVLRRTDTVALDEFELRLKKVEESMLPMTPQTDGASRSQEGGRQASTGMKTRVQVCRMSKFTLSKHDRKCKKF